MTSSLPVEIIVVDNGSTDGTADVVRTFMAASPVSATYVREPTPGLSRARNTGTAAACGAVVLFTDDDVMVPPSWPDALAGPIESGRAVATVGEINIAPHLMREWMTDEDMGFFVSTLSAGDHNSPNLIGASMAIRRAALEGLGGFDERLGLGTSIPGGEDLILTQLLRDAGERVELVLGAPVVHAFDATRLEVRDRLSRRRIDAAYHAWLRWNYYEQRTSLAFARAALLTPPDWLIRRCAPRREGRAWPVLERLVYARQFHAVAAKEQRHPPAPRFAQNRD